MIAFRAHTGGGGDRKVYRFKDTADMLAHPWINDCKDGELLGPFFKRFVKSDAGNGNGYLMVELIEKKATSEGTMMVPPYAVIGYYEGNVDLPEWVKPGVSP